MDTIPQSEVEALVAARLRTLNPAPYQQGVSEGFSEVAFPLSPESAPESLAHLAFTVDVVDGSNTGQRQQRTSIEVESLVEVRFCYRTRGEVDGITDKRKSLDLCGAAVAMLKLQQPGTWPPPGLTVIIPSQIGRLIELSSAEYLARSIILRVRHDIPLIPLEA